MPVFIRYAWFSGFVARMNFQKLFRFNSRSEQNNKIKKHLSPGYQVYLLQDHIKRRLYKGLFIWTEGAPANWATWGGLNSHTFLSKMHQSVYMLDRVARLPGAPCLLARGTWLGGVAFCHVNASSQAILANRGEINRENMAGRS